MFNLQNEEPFDLLDRWMGEAASSEVNDPEAAALATVSKAGWPSVRMVLIRGRDDEALHFFTNYTSRKATEIEATGKAALCLHWKSLRRQIRLVGGVSRLEGDACDAYYESRPWGSKIGAWASDQSSPLASHEELKMRVASAEKTHGKEPPRPPFWGGYRLIPNEIEFWVEGESRLHDRFRFTQNSTDRGKNWDVTRLYP